MAAYGGYQRTGYGQGGEDGGGFMGASQQGSQGGNAGGKSYDDETLRPLTIKQLLDCDEAYAGAELAIDGRPVTQITIVGQIRSITPLTTNITYRIDDGTGTIDVKKWIDAERGGGGGGDEDGADGAVAFQLDQYVRVWGRIKAFNNKKHIGANAIRAIEDFNEVNYHLLEATYVHLLLLKGGTAGAAGGQGGGAAGGEDGMFVDGYEGAGGAGAAAGANGSSKVAGRSRPAQTMFHFLESTPGGNEGVHLNVIASGTNLPIRDVIAAADELLSHGLIYTTMDDETWAILDY